MCACSLIAAEDLTRTLRLTGLVDLSQRQMDYLKSGRVSRQASLSRDGSLHLVPVCHAYDGENICIASMDRDAKKVRNVRENPRVSLLVDDYSEDWNKCKGLMIQGEASLVERGEVFVAAKKLLDEKYPQWEEEPYSIEEGTTPVIKVRPMKVVSWDYSSPDGVL